MSIILILTDTEIILVIIIIIIHSFYIALFSDRPDITAPVDWA